MKKTMILMLAMVFAISSVALATDSRKCSRTTKKCGTRIVRPLKGYGGQCSKHQYRRYRYVCAGCGGELDRK